MAIKNDASRLTTFLLGMKECENLEVPGIYYTLITIPCTGTVCNKTMKRI